MRLPCPYNFYSPFTFIPRNFFNGALNFRQIERLALQGYRISKDGLDLGEFVVIARNESKFQRWHFEGITGSFSCMIR